MRITDVRREKQGYHVKYTTNGKTHEIYFSNRLGFEEWKQREKYAVNMTLIVVSLVVLSISFIMFTIYSLIQLYQIK